LEIMITSDWKCSQQCEYAYSEANRVVAVIRRTITYKEPKIMLSVHKTLVRPHVEYCSCAWNLPYKKDKELLEKIRENDYKHGRKDIRRKVKVVVVMDIRRASE